MDSTARRRWKAAGAEDIDWRSWDGEVVARVARSGATYLLSETASAAFTQLNAADSALSAPELAVRLFPDAGEEPEQTRHETRQALEVLLAELQALGLVRPLAQ